MTVKTVQIIYIFLKNNIQLYWYQNLNKKLKNSIDKMAVTVYNKAIKNK